MTLNWIMDNGLAILTIIFSVVRLMESVYVKAKASQPVDLVSITKEFFTFG